MKFLFYFIELGDKNFITFNWSELCSNSLPLFKTQRNILFCMIKWYLIQGCYMPWCTNFNWWVSFQLIDSNRRPFLSIFFLFPTLKIDLYLANWILIQNYVSFESRVCLENCSLSRLMGGRWESPFGPALISWDAHHFLTEDSRNS